MTIWSSEIRELEKLHHSIQKTHPSLVKELSRLIRTDDENMALVYARRCLEIIISDLCESELNRPRGSEPLKRIIDKLNREEKVPQNIIASMNNINSVATFGAHPKEFDPQQVKPVLLDLSTTLGWFIKYSENRGSAEMEVPDTDTAKSPPDDSRKLPDRFRNRILIVAVITLLLALVLILLYPKIFKPDQLDSLRDEEGMISVAVLPFDNLTGDSSLYYWQNGISEYLINSLGSSSELAVSSSQVISDLLAGTRRVNEASLAPDIARRTAGKINASAYITGRFIGNENNANILLNLVDTEKGELIWSTRVEGDLGSDYQRVLEHLSDTVKNYMEIRVLEDQVESDLTHAFPKSAEAYRYYIEGLNAFVDGQYASAKESLKEAYEIDTTFTFAAFYLAFTQNFGGPFNEEMVNWVKRAHELKKNLPPAYRPWIEMWYACFVTEDLEDIRKYCDMMSEAAINSRLLLMDLGATYHSFLRDYMKSIRSYQRIEALNTQWNDPWRFERYYQSYSQVLLLADRPEEALRIIGQGLEINPDNGNLMMKRLASYIMLKDTSAVDRISSEYRIKAEQMGVSESRLIRLLGDCYMYAKDTLEALNHYRGSYEMDPEDYYTILGLLECEMALEVNLEENLRMARLGAQARPGWVGFPRAEGLILYKMGRHEEALAVLEEAHNHWINASMGLKMNILTVEKALAREERQ